MEEVYKKFGALLRLERERRGLNIDDLSDQLKISAENLSHLEEGRFDVLPSELYYNLFAKSYAELLGIDFTRTLDAIKEDVGQTPASEPANGESRIRSTEPNDASEPEADEAPRPRRKKGLVVAAIVVGVTFVAFLVSYGLLYDEDEYAHEFGNTDEAIEGNDASAAGLQAELAGYSWSTPPDSLPDSLVLTVTAREESWATILADGDTAVFRNLVPWREYRIAAQYRLRVSIFRTSVVETKLNGELVDLRDPETRRITQVEINQVNLNQVLNPGTAIDIEPPPATTRPQVQATTKNPDQSHEPSSSVNQPEVTSPQVSTEEDSGTETQEPEVTPADTGAGADAPAEDPSRRDNHHSALERQRPAGTRATATERPAEEPASSQDTTGNGT